MSKTATCVNARALKGSAAAMTVGTGTASATFAAPSAPDNYEVTATGFAGFKGSFPIAVIAVVPSVPVLPGRVFESRSGSADLVTVDGLYQGAGRTDAGQVVEVQVTGRAGGPVGAEAVFLNVVAVGPSGSGYLTVFPCGATPPLAANVNYNTGDVAANAVFAKIGDDGQVCVHLRRNRFGDRRQRVHPGEHNCVASDFVSQFASSFSQHVRVLDRA